jgi:hypothetical protein
MVFAWIVDAVVLTFPSGLGESRATPQLQRHIWHQVECGKGHQRACNHSEEAADNQSYKGKDQHDQYHRDGKESMLIVERPSLDILEGIGKGHDEWGRHMNTIDLF